ncbi:LysE family translocator [Paraglaciecola sp. 25GB23A]|uniref:LysE family translocator n=1 Tax=Paraglaciecola sp. 25GB23A TaxID=3156068 RepID=UPI0032AFEAEC
MLSIDTLTAFSLAAFLLCISPGPSNLYIMARSISQGQKAGMIAASGMALGSFIYVIASAFGLAAIFIYLPLAYTLVKLAGAAYLIYLSIQYLRLAKCHSQGIIILNTLSSRRIFKQSLVVELTNPKTALFFIAFLPLFTEPSQGHMTLQLLILGTIYALIGLLSDLCVATLSGKIGRWMSAHPHSEQWQNRLSALLLFTIGGFIVYDESLKFLI